MTDTVLHINKSISDFEIGGCVRVRVCFEERYVSAWFSYFLSKTSNKQVVVYY